MNPPVPLPNVPAFLIIGAMKAGTTSVYEDLRGVEALYMVPEKEPEDLIDPAVETPEGLERYRRKFRRAPAGALSGEASTAYAKRPTYEGVAERALRVLGPHLKIIYFRREPVARIVSQYRHQVALGLETRPFDQAVASDPTYVDYSRYEWQLVPWRDCFGDDQILVLDFEDYVADTSGVIDRLCRFLGVEPAGPVSSSHRNAAEGKLVLPPDSLRATIRNSRLYLDFVKPLIPVGLRDALKGVVLPSREAPPVVVSDETRARILAQLAEQR